MAAHAQHRASATRHRPMLVGAATAALAVGVIGASAGETHIASVQAVAPSPPPGAVALQNAFVQALQRAQPSVVEISTTTGLGSGVIYDARGDVVTNAHVVAGAQSFTVLRSNGTKTTARLIGQYVPDDLAVLRMANTAGIRPASFADSSKLRPGDLVLAIGSPLGLSGSATDGIVSSTGRTVAESTGVALSDLIQTSAAINPGNSGGALVNLVGAVVGIPTLAATNQESGTEAAGLGFAIPSRTVTLIAPQLIANGKVTTAGRAAIGISGQTVYNSTSGSGGVYVSAVTPDGPAARAGVRPGDVITAIGNTPVNSFEDLVMALAKLHPGQKVNLSYLRAGTTKVTTTVVLGDLARM
ncbi:MAG: trypsin-like peptidase domain-containing protein [Actinomycetota bacterium]|nr:trypsin-like peptidase domain-containing protein [Actinomycetota bacterium]